MEDKSRLFPIIDGHVDVLYGMMRHHESIPFHRISKGPVTHEKLSTADVRVIVSALYCPDSHNGTGSSLSFLEALLKYAEDYLTGMKHIKTAADLHSCYAGNSRPGALALLENADALMEMDLERLKAESIVAIGLTHAGTNRIGDGNGVEHPAGLTRDGKQVVRDLDRMGFAIDVAHLSDPCFQDLVDLFSGPIISSHTGFRFFCDRRRNLDEDHLKILFERKGMVGVTVNPEMLSVKESAGIEEVFGHIDWVVQKYGADCVGLGSDYWGFDVVSQGLEDASKLRDLPRLLHKHGYPSDAIAKIMGDNWYRFYSSLLPP